MARLAKDWHWGVPARKVIEWSEWPYPSHGLIEIGRLAELHVIVPGMRSEQILRLTPNQRMRSHLAFDPKHRYQRMYLFTPADVRSIAVRGWEPARSVMLPKLAQEVGDLHGSVRDYPPIRVTPLGKLHHVVYYTNKGRFSPEDAPDGLSLYDHELAEDGGTMPQLGVDARGRFWLAGGSYVCRREGITN